MKAFIDTSTLIKKYISEGDHKIFDTWLETVTEIIISPITWLEIQSMLERRIRDKSLTPKDATTIEKNCKIDLDYFGVIKWSETLETLAQLLIRKYQLKVLDSLQLASGKLSKADHFFTSDIRLFKAAEQELNTIFIA